MTGQNEAVLRRKAVESRVGLSRTTIYDMTAKGAFPRQIQLGPRAVGWRESDINAWIASRQEAAKREQTTVGR